jgi:hypothetical protein
VFSFDEWNDEQPPPAPPQPKVFHFDEWSEEDSEFDESTVYTTMPDGNDSERRQIEDDFHNDSSRWNNNFRQEQPTRNLAPLDTTISTLSSSSSSSNENSNMPYCESIPRNIGIDTSNSNFVDNRSSSSSKSVSSIPEVIIIRKRGRLRRQLARSWRRIVGKSSRRCEV